MRRTLLPGRRVVPDILHFSSNEFLALSLTRNLIFDLQKQFTVYLVLESAIQGRQTMRRLAPNLCLVIVLAASSFSAHADENKSGGSSASLAPRARIECSLKRKPGEPLDPPSTAAIPHAESFVASEHFKEDITPTAALGRAQTLGGLDPPQGGLRSPSQNPNGLVNLDVAVSRKSGCRLTPAAGPGGRDLIMRKSQ